MKKVRQNLYEGMYIINATLSEEARAKAIEKIQKEIEERGGVVEKMFDQGRRKLAYEIENRREGYYYILYFRVNTQAIKELWREYHLHEDLIRFITLRVETVPEEIVFKPIVEEPSPYKMRIPYEQPA